MENWWSRNGSIPSRNKEEESIWRKRYKQRNKQTNIQTNRQSQRQKIVDSYARRGVNKPVGCRCLGNKGRTRWSSPLVGPNISGLCGIQHDSWAILSKNSPNLTKCCCHSNRGRPHNIVHGSIEWANPENPLLGANIWGLSAIQAELYAIFGQILGSQFWGLGSLNQKSKNNVL